MFFFGLSVGLAQATKLVDIRCWRSIQFAWKLLKGKLKHFAADPSKKAMKATKKVATKAMKGQKAMSKGGLTGELANATELKKAEITKVLNALAEIGAGEVKKTGKFTLPGLCMIKTRQKKATKAGKKMMFGQEVMVKAQPAKTVVKAFPVAALKSQI